MYFNELSPIIYINDDILFSLYNNEDIILEKFNNMIDDIERINNLEKQKDKLISQFIPITNCLINNNFKRALDINNDIMNCY